MSCPTVKIAALVTAIVAVAVIATKSSSRAESKPTRQEAIDVSETTEARIDFL